MAYNTEATLLEQVSAAQLIQLTDDAQLGIVNSTTLGLAIAGADAEVDSFLRTGGYVLPLAVPVPILIVKWARDITIYNLYRRRQRLPEAVRQAYEDTIAALTQVARGTRKLEVTSVPVADDTQGGAVYGPARLFDRTTLESF